MQQKSDSVLARVSRELSQLEKRDWELWVIVSLAGVLVGIGFLAILFPAAFLSQGNFRFEVTVSKQLVIALATLLILLNTYLVTRRLELRKMREGLVSGPSRTSLFGFNRSPTLSPKFTIADRSMTWRLATLAKRGVRTNL